jgi:hypothetical protein
MAAAATMRLDDRELLRPPQIQDGAIVAMRPSGSADHRVPAPAHSKQLGT